MGEELADGGGDLVGTWSLGTVCTRAFIRFAMKRSHTLSVDRPSPGHTLNSDGITGDGRGLTDGLAGSKQHRPFWKNP